MEIMAFIITLMPPCLLHLENPTAQQEEDKTLLGGNVTLNLYTSIKGSVVFSYAIFSLNVALYM